MELNKTAILTFLPYSSSFQSNLSCNSEYKWKIVLSFENEMHFLTFSKVFFALMETFGKLFSLSFTHKVYKTKKAAVMSLNQRIDGNLILSLN